MTSLCHINRCYNTCFITCVRPARTLKRVLCVLIGILYSFLLEIGMCLIQDVSCCIFSINASKANVQANAESLKNLQNFYYNILGRFTTVFQAKLFVIIERACMCKNRTNFGFWIFISTASQATLNVLDSNNFNLELV